MGLWNRFGFKVTFSYEENVKTYDSDLNYIPINKLEEFKSNLNNFFNNENLKCKSCKSKKIMGNVNVKIKVYEIFKEVEKDGFFGKKFIDKKIDEQFFYYRYGFENDYFFKCKNCGVVFSDNTGRRVDDYMITSKNYLQHFINLIEAPDSLYNWTIKMLMGDVNKNFLGSPV